MKDMDWNDRGRVDGIVDWPAKVAPLGTSVDSSLGEHAQMLSLGHERGWAEKTIVFSSLHFDESWVESVYLIVLKCEKKHVVRCR